MKKNEIRLICIIFVLLFFYIEQLKAGSPPLIFEMHSETFGQFNLFQNNFSKIEKKYTDSTGKKDIFSNAFQNDSTHKLNFRYPGEKKGLKPFIAPALLMATGTIIHYVPEIKQQFRDYSKIHFVYHGDFDDYAQYAPIVALYTFHVFGMKGKNNFGNVTAIAIKSFILNGVLTTGLKYGFAEKRPNGGLHSFPSGHTSKAFSLAHILHKEYGEKSVWFSIGAYSCAATVGAMRIAKDAHWISDVFAGAGIGILSTELIYLTHLYKWDNEHIRRLDIFPFQTRNQKGLSLVYTF